MPITLSAISHFRPGHLSGWSHEFIATVAFLVDQNFAFRSVNFLDWLQAGKERLVSGHGSLKLIQLLSRLQGISEANAPHARSL
jgi:hypothetical protein